VTVVVGTHPLDPLSAGELAAAVDAVRASGRLQPQHLFVAVQLDEPSKEALARWADGEAIERRARAVVWDPLARRLSEALVSTACGLIAWTDVPGAHAPGLPVQLAAAVGAALADPRVREGLRARGVEDPDRVHAEAWPIGGLADERYGGERRLVWTPMWERRASDDNPYAHPIHGLYAVVDLDGAEVLHVEEHGAMPIPREPGHYRASQVPARPAAGALEIAQPAGPGFTLDGWRLEWEEWSLRVGFCPREGLVIHDVAYGQRPIAHRLSIAELVIPYGDPSPGSYRKNAFDTGEVYLGNLTNSLTLGCDCLGEIRYLDVAVVANDGSVRTIADGICIHEEDDGILWKHTDSDGHVEVRRSRRLVVSSIVTIDNYEYGYFWYLRQDGSIEFEAKLTGIVLTLAGDSRAPSPYASELAPGLYGPNHQHLFCARLDLDVDGERNSVVEVDTVTPPLGPENPYGGAFLARETLLERESVAMRDADPLRARHWKVVNPRRLNRLGHPVGYRLEPTHPVAGAALAESSIGRRAAFMRHQLWVTRFDAAERYPAGEYPFQHPGGDGLPAWTAADRELVDTDVVLWHVFGSTHVPRVEDWPVMPVERVGFRLRPAGFFERSPALDVPPPAACHPGA
jgi:primary-amine oxidase